MCTSRRSTPRKRPGAARALSTAYRSFLRDNLPACVASPAPWAALLVRACRDGVRGAADGGAGLAPRLAVAPDVTQQLHTTQTPSFLRLSESSGLLQASGGEVDETDSISPLDTNGHGTHTSSTARGQRRLL